MPGKMLECKTSVFCQSKLAKCKHQTIFATKWQTFKINSNHRSVQVASGGFFVCSICPTLLLPFCKSCLVLQNKLPAPQAHFARNCFVVTKQFAKFSTTYQNPRCQAHAFLWQSFKGLRNQNYGQFCLFFCANPLLICQSMFCQIAIFFLQNSQTFCKSFLGQLGLHTMHKR